MDRRLQQPAPSAQVASTRKGTRLRLAALALAATGLAASLYLSVQAVAMETGQLTGVIALCGSWLGGDCTEILGSRLPWLPGIPVAGWGVVYFGTVAALLALRYWLEPEFAAPGSLLTLALVTVGATVSVALTTHLLVWLGPCPSCLLIHANNLLLLGCVWWEHRIETRIHLQAPPRHRPSEESAGTEARDQWHLIAYLTLGLIAVALFQWVAMLSADKGQEPGESAVPEMLGHYAATPRHDIPLRPDDPTLGPADAAVVMVLFGSFQCPGCQQVMQELPALMERFDQQLRVVFKHYPLGSACNPRLKADRYPFDCEVAQAAEAARHQGRFWDFHDRLNAAGGSVDLAGIQRAARQAGLATELYLEDVNDAALAERVAEDVALGNRLGVNATPAIFVNGRRVSPLSLSALSHVLAYETAAVQRR